MKLRNLLFGTALACAFVGCSNDNDPILGPDQPSVAEGEATLSVKIDRVQTKASDTDITTLHVLIFKGTEDNAPLEKIGTATSGDAAVGEVNDIPVTSGNKKVLVLANATIPAGWKQIANKETGTSFEDVLKATKDFGTGATAEVDGNLSMNSKVYDVTLTVSTINCLGFTATTASGETQAIVKDESATAPVKLYRNVAKISLEKITNTPALGYKEAKLTVKSVFLIHGKKTTKLFGKNAAEWGSTEELMANTNYLNGYPTGDSYKKWVDYVKNFEAVYNYIPEANYETKCESYTNYVENVTAFDVTATSTSDWAKTYYAYENTDENAYTLLVIKGDYSYTDVNGATKTETDRYYPVAVGVSGNPSLPISFTGLSHGRSVTSGVLRNLWYKVSMTVAGPGYETPFGPKPGDEDGDTFLSVKCQVVEFGAVDQDGGEIE